MAVQLPDSTSDRQTCDYCDAHVTPEFRRIYGTDDGCAKRCPECDSWARIMRGSARRDVDHPDPQENPNRTGGKELRRNCVADGGGQA